MHSLTVQTTAAFVCAVFTAGCATMINGSNQMIHVNTAPPAARVSVQPGGTSADTPADLRLKRSKSGYLLRIEKGGFRTEEIRIGSTTSEWVVANIIIGGLIGLAIDYGSGAAYDLTPSAIDVSLAPERSSIGDLPPGEPR